MRISESLSKSLAAKTKNSFRVIFFSHLCSSRKLVDWKSSSGLPFSENFRLSQWLFCQYIPPCLFFSVCVCVRVFSCWPQPAAANVSQQFSRISVPNEPHLHFKIDYAYLKLNIRRFIKIKPLLLTFYRRIVVVSVGMLCAFATIWLCHY